MSGTFIANLLISIAALWGLVWLIGSVLFRREAFPKRQLFSLPLAWASAVFVAGYFFSGSEQPRYDLATLQYGIAALLLGTFYVSSYFAYRKLDRGEE